MTVLRKKGIKNRIKGKIDGGEKGNNRNEREEYRNGAKNKKTEQRA